MTALSLLLALRPIPEALRRGRTVAQGLAPLGLAGLLAAVFFVFSAAGGAPGPTARYVLFVVPLLLCCLGLLFARLSLRSFPIALTLALCVVVLNVSTYELLPMRPRREAMRRGAEADARIVSFLETRGIRAVFGDYWTVYPLNFLSRERVLGIPTNPATDYYEYAKRLPAQPAPWALMAWWPEELERFALRTGVRGESLEPTPGIYVFLPSDGTPPVDALVRLRRAP